MGDSLSPVSRGSDHGPEVKRVYTMLIAYIEIAYW